MRETRYVIRYTSSMKEKPKYWQSSTRCWVWDKFKATSFPTRKNCDAFLKNTGMVGVSWAIVTTDNKEKYKEYFTKCDYTSQEAKVASLYTGRHPSGAKRFPEVDRVIFSPPYTIVFWKNQKEGEDKTTVKVMDGDVFDEGTGFAAALAKRIYGSHHQYKKFIKKAYRQDNTKEKK